MKAISTIQAKQKGFSLVELLLVLGVIALIAIAAFIIYPSVQAGTQANTESSNLTAVIAGTKNLFGAKGVYTGLTPAVACQAHIFPSTMVAGNFASNCAPQASWGGTVDIKPVASSGGVANGAFEVTYDSVPGEVCTKLISGVAANFDTVGKTSGGSEFKASGAAPDPVATATICGGFTGVAGNKIYFDSK